MTLHNSAWENLVTRSYEYNQAQESSLPCVALESTVIAKGLPYRDNLQVARQCEEVIRNEGVIPVTIGIWEGRIMVGMSSEQIEFFARHHEKIHKVNLQNLSYVVSQKLYGATTVAATVYIASKMGIPLMATGGIGGVHRDVESTLDISADPGALASNPVGVVSSGAKCILDIPKTLELLETLGIPVIGYRTSHFPLFYSNEPLFPLEQTFTDTVDIAHFLRYHFTVSPQKGVLISNPVPSKDTLHYKELNKIIQEALKEGQKSSITGKEMTPFLLDRLARATHNKSIFVNKKLLVSNARLAARIAKDYKWTA